MSAGDASGASGLSLVFAGRDAMPICCADPCWDEAAEYERANKYGRSPEPPKSAENLQCRKNGQCSYPAMLATPRLRIEAVWG